MREKGKKNLEHMLEMGEEEGDREAGVFSASSDNNELRRESSPLRYNIVLDLYVQYSLLYATSNTTNVPSSIQRQPG
jgi:hypothetical protein